jgi:hypothetical protein
MHVPGVRRRNLAGMLDRAPVLLRATRDFEDIGHQSIRVGAIPTIEPLNAIEITQSAPVKKQVVWTTDFWYPVDRETDTLIDGDEEIEEQKRNKA